jgi:hypothetical protein
VNVINETQFGFGNTAILVEELTLYGKAALVLAYVAAWVTIFTVAS